MGKPMFFEASNSRALDGGYANNAYIVIRLRDLLCSAT